MNLPSTGTHHARVCGIVCAVALLIGPSGCTAPGKPGPGETPAENVLDFAILYQTNCQACHGPNGKNGPGRPLNNPLYLAIVPRDALVNVITNGRGPMPAWAKSQGGPMTDKQIQVVVNGIESWAKPVHFSAPPPAYSAANTTGDAAAGKKLFLRDCFPCHGQGAPIGPITDPSYLALASNQIIRTTIIVGWPELGMPNYQILNAGRPLSDQNVSDLVAYLASKRPPNLNGPGNGFTNAMGNGQTGEMTMGNKGSGNGPGSPAQGPMKNEPHKGSSSQGGGR